MEGGKIAAIGPAEAMPPASERSTRAASTFCRVPSTCTCTSANPASHKETWTSATQAAAVGGVTTVFDMPNTNPPTSTPEAVLQKLEIAQRQAVVDFGVYGNIGEHNTGQLKAVAEAGAVSFKLYMGSEIHWCRARRTARSSMRSKSWPGSASVALFMPRARRS